MPDLFDPPPDPDVPNVFEDQRFRLRTSDGERVTRSFRQIVTEADPDAAYALDYPQAFYNVAALNLLAFLAQWAFEPRDAAALAARVEAPMTESEFERVVGPLRQSFALAGNGPRFMQAPAPDDPKKEKKLVEVAVLITHAGDKAFLHRADSDWAIGLDQAALLLFARNTFYEGKAGQGYQKGTNGNTPVRTLVVVPAGGSGTGETIQLRKSLWLNVLSRDHQEDTREYPPTGEGYDGAFWIDPPDDHIPTGGISLRSGLGWMTAFHWLWLGPLDGPAVCAVTGQPLASGTVAARDLTRWSTGVAYGTKSDMEAKTRADRLFRHPNVPLAKIYDKTGDAVGRYQVTVNRTSGLVNAVGASFFGSARGRFEPAPAVEQLAETEIWDLGLPLQLLTFGFHMSAGNVIHDAIEIDTFRYAPLVGPTEADTLDANDQAADLLYKASAFAEVAGRDLGTAVQRAAGLGVRSDEDAGTGRVSVQPKFASTSSVADPFAADTLAAFWRDVQTALGAYALSIAEAARDDGETASPTALGAARDALVGQWEDQTVALVWHHFRPVYDHHVVHARTMPYAAAAFRMLGGALAKHRTMQPVDAP